MAVVRIKDVSDWSNTVRIDRRTKWGNPYAIGVNGRTREQVIAMYRSWLWDQLHMSDGLITLEDLQELAGKDLACWCAPHACHGHVLEKAVAWACSDDDVGA